MAAEEVIEPDISGFPGSLAEPQGDAAILKNSCHAPPPHSIFIISEAFYTTLEGIVMHSQNTCYFHDQYSMCYAFG